MEAKKFLLRAENVYVSPEVTLVSSESAGLICASLTNIPEEDDVIEW